MLANQLSLDSLIKARYNSNTAMKTTHYFDASVMVRRPYLRTEWIELALSHPIRVEIQDNGRIRRWVWIEETGKYLRVVTEPGGETVHNAFFDRRFRG